MQRLERIARAAAFAAVLAAPLVAGAAQAQVVSANPPADQTAEPAKDQAELPAETAAPAAESAKDQTKLPAQADATNCPEHPDALGTSRVLAVDFSAYRHVGRMQYGETLPLNDKEVVLTFDDGPLPPYTNQVLDVLDAQCVKATFFMVGEMARAFPATVRRIYEDGQTIGTHSDHHPIGFGRMPLDRIDREIDGGIADVAGAFGGDPKYLAPFFRIPGLERSDTVESELAARGLIVFSSDTVADDWHHHIKAQQIIDLALKRLEARGRGILLLHDIHATTAAALPGLLQRLKDDGFHVVQVVPSAAYEIAMAHRPATAMLASTLPGELAIGHGIDSQAVPSWPQTTDDLMPDSIGVPVPDAASFEPDAGLSVDNAEPQWPDRPPELADLSTPEPPAPHRHKNARLDRRRKGRLADHAEKHGHGHGSDHGADQPRPRAEHRGFHPHGHAKASAEGRRV